MSANFFYESIHRAYDGRPYIDLQMTNLNYFSHFHDEIELIYVASGTVQLHTNSRSYTINTGETGIVMPGEIHSYTSEVVNHCYIIKFFPMTKTESVNFSTLRFVDHVINHNHPCHSTVHRLMNNIAKEMTDKNCGYELSVNCDLSGIILLFLRNMPFGHISGEEDKKQTKQLVLLQKVDEYVNRNYNRHISLEDISACCGYSTYYFSHFFKEATGQNFSDYLVLFRIERALYMIANTDKNLTDIAFDCGFNSIRSFNRAFHNHLKITPSECRKKNL